MPPLNVASVIGHKTRRTFTLVTRTHIRHPFKVSIELRLRQIRNRSFVTRHGLIVFNAYTNNDLWSFKQHHHLNRNTNKPNTRTVFQQYECKRFLTPKWNTTGTPHQLNPQKAIKYPKAPTKTRTNPIREHSSNNTNTNSFSSQNKARPKHYTKTDQPI